MALRVVVVDPLPLYRRGVATVLSAAGFHVETPADLVAWSGAEGDRVVLLSLLSPPDWELLGRLGRRASGVIAVLEGGPAGEGLGASGLRAVRSGAASVMSRAVEAAVLVRTVEATAGGQAVLPAGVLAALAGRDPSAADPVPGEKVSWLRHLAAGSTVAELAGRAGYSERAMFRMLRSLYRDMGVDSRIEAIMRARDLGWLPASPEDSPRRA